MFIRVILNPIICGSIYNLPSCYTLYINKYYLCIHIFIPNSSWCFNKKLVFKFRSPLYIVIMYLKSFLGCYNISDAFLCQEFSHHPLDNSLTKVSIPPKLKCFIAHIKLQYCNILSGSYKAFIQVLKAFSVNCFPSSMLWKLFVWKIELNIV